MTTKRSLIASFISLLLCLSMLIGTTFAWFTDAVTSNSNLIQAGKLDAEMYWSDTLLDADSDQWQSADGVPVFTYDKWEPGYTEVKYVKIANNGNLSFKWQLTIEAESAVGKLAEVIDVYYVNPVSNEIISLDGLTSAGELVDVIGNRTATAGVLLPEGETSNEYLAGSTILAIAFHMQEDAGNDYQNESVGDGFSLKLLATQFSYENDTFGNKYDENATWPKIDLITVGSVDIPANAVDSSGALTENLTINSTTNSMSVTVPAGVKVADGATELVLKVGVTDRSSNISMSDGQASRSLDVHVDGIASDNNVPMIIDLGAVLPAGYNPQNISLYHVENDTANKMTLVDSFTAHNQFTYDANTGSVSIYIASFSEVTAVVNAGDPWTGELDISWYNTSDTEFTLANEAQFAGFGAIVGGMVKDANNERIQDDFKGKTVKLGADLNMGGSTGKILYPVGYYNSSYSYERTSESITSNVSSFEGIFDGQNYTITNVYQNTWSMFGDYNSGYPAGSNYYKDGMGIFGFVYNGTIKNLVVNDFSSDGEFSTTGCVAAYTSGSSTFENIKVYNSNPRAYNVPNGGVVGYAYAESGATNVINFNNIEVDVSNKITALWGSWDVGCGGILGRVNGETTVNMSSCTVGAVIDVYNDVCGNYQYYQYRYSGMLIGTVGGDTDPLSGGEKVNFSNVKVYIGNWADYYFCEFEKNSGASYTVDFQFSRVEKNEINIDPTTNLPYTQHLSPCRHNHTENEDKMGLYLPFNQLYTGYGWGSTPVREAEGVEVIQYFYTVKYMNATGTEVLAIDYVTEGERSESKLWADAYTAKSASISEIPANKEFVGWVNSDSVVTKSISAGNNDDVVLYESWDDPFTIRFVDKDGNVIYSALFTKTDQSNIVEPQVPRIEGYVGEWEDYQDKLKVATADITVKPIYVLEEYADNDSEHVHLDSNVTAEQLFKYLEEGKSVVMGSDLTHSGGNLTGGVTTLCNMAGDTARLNLNTYQLTCNFGHNANKEWHIFNLTNSSTLTLSGGVNSDGKLLMNIKNIKSNVYVFSVDASSTLILEAGVVIEITYPTANGTKVYGFEFDGKVYDFANYTGIYVERIGTSSDPTNTLRITVGVTTTINKDTINNFAYSNK